MTRDTKRHHVGARLEIRTDGDPLPAGIAGRVAGVALTYGTVDSYGTMFQRGAAARSINGKVKARKVPLLMDHDRSVASHVGVVASMTDIGDALVMTADIFDTPDGRAALEYVKAVMAADASTGFSIGFVPRQSQRVMIEGQPVELFTEIELREVSITPMPAVPGADVTAARNEPEQDTTPEPEAVRDDATLLRLAAMAALDALPEDDRQTVLRRYRVDTAATLQEMDHARQTASTAPAANADLTPAPVLATTVSMADRVHAVRRSFHVTHSR
jgi:HK97 family phage prohead protease